MRLVIVGGVAAGMSCAARARRLAEDAEIIVLEKGPYVSFANCGLPYYVGGEIGQQTDLLVQTPERLAAALNLDVRPFHEVVQVAPDSRTIQVNTPHGSHEISYDALVLAPGATAVTPPIPGIAESKRIHPLRSIEDAEHLRQLSEGAKTAVVIGSGFIGLEAAEVLRNRGLTVHLVEAAPQVLPPLEPELAALVSAELHRAGVLIHRATQVREITAKTAADEVVLTSGEIIVADLIVLATGVRPATDFLRDSGIELESGAIVVDEFGRTNLPQVWAAGDAARSRHAITGQLRPVTLAGPANRTGRLVADAIFRPEQARPAAAPMGTAIVRVFSKTVAMTGANRHELATAGIPFQTLHSHPLQHAGYFPGAEALHLLVHVGAAGELLGAQAVGPDGVDKRIDVLATAMRAGLRAADLIDLDLAYAPPYGQAKDPVNHIGLMAENLQAGLLQVWSPADLLEVQDHALILDTRTAAEFARGHLPEALNVPHTELRSRLAEVSAAAQGRPIRVMCASGMRSYLAHRILAQAGFDSATLTGGMQSLVAYHGAQILDSAAAKRTAH